MKTKDQRPKTKDQKKEAKEFSIPVYNSKGKEIEKLALDKGLFTGNVNKKVLYQAVLMYNANQRRGTASTKTRSDVSGGGKKPWRQKGTGRARAGSTRSPLWRGGGKIFGPHPRDFHYELPKKVKRVAFLSSLNSKVVEKRFICVDAINISDPKTKNFMEIVNNLKLKGKQSLFIFDNIDEKIKRASRNLADALVKNYRDFNTMDVLKSDTIVMTKSALEKLPERFKS